MSDPEATRFREKEGLLNLDRAGLPFVPAAAATADWAARPVGDKEDAVRRSERRRIESDRLGEAVPANLLLVEAAQQKHRIRVPHAAFEQGKPVRERSVTVPHILDNAASNSGRNSATGAERDRRASIGRSPRR